MIKLLRKFNDYFGRVLDTVSLKRSISDDDDDDDDSDIEVDLHVPPLKRSRYADMDSESDVKIAHAGLNLGRRISDANLYPYGAGSHSSFEMPSSKGVEKIIPIHIESSVSSNKENAPCSFKSPFTKSKDECTPITSKYFINSKFKFQPSVENKLMSSFKFRPPVTSTAQKPNSSEGLSATKRKPLRCFSPKWKAPPRSPNYVQSLRLNDLSRNFKKRNVNSTLYGMHLTPRASIRLDEKMRYSQLIQQHTTSVVNSRTMCRKSPFLTLISRGVFDRNDAIEKSGAIIKTHLDPRLTMKSKLLMEKREESPIKSPKQIPGEINITRDSDSKTVPFIDLEPPEMEINKEVKLDEDLFIVKEIKAPVSRKNSLENELQKSFVYGNGWLQEFTSDFYEDKKKSTDDDVEIMFETKKKYQEERERHEKELMKKVEDRVSQLDISYPCPFIEAAEEEEEKLPELTPEMEKVIERAFRGGPLSQVLAEKFNIQITRRDIHTLAGLNWLNDEVINFYMNMLMERGKNDNYPSVYTFNTFFYSKLVKTGYASVKRWTKKVDIFSFDLLIIPVHLGMHWCLSTIDFRKKTIKYYDSMHGNNNNCLVQLSKYLESEHQDKKKSSYDVSAFSAENVKDIPQQMNGSDCGMFSCKFAEYLSRDAPITFSQENMPYFRRRMVYEIVTQKLM